MCRGKKKLLFSSVYDFYIVTISVFWINRCTKVNNWFQWVRLSIWNSKNEIKCAYNSEYMMKCTVFSVHGQNSNFVYQKLRIRIQINSITISSHSSYVLYGVICSSFVADYFGLIANWMGVNPKIPCECF